MSLRQNVFIDISVLLILFLPILILNVGEHSTEAEVVYYNMMPGSSNRSNIKSDYIIL